MERRIEYRAYRDSNAGSIIKEIHSKMALTVCSLCRAQAGCVQSLVTFGDANIKKIGSGVEENGQ